MSDWAQPPTNGEIDPRANPRGLAGETSAEDPERETLLNNLSRTAGTYRQLIETFRTPGWIQLSELVEMQILAEQDALVTCKPEAIQSHRDRITFLRWLLGLPADTSDKLEAVDLQLVELEPEELIQGDER